MKVLIVGDMHAVPEELNDCNRVIQLIIDLARTDDELREVWFTGDQHHTHAVVRLEVMHWWKTAFKALKSVGLNVTCLVGNHDQSSPGSTIHAMMAYEGNGVLVVDKPTVREGVLLLPYYHDQETFLAACRDHWTGVPSRFEDGYAPETNTVFCHQTFDGAMYENGFPASDGFDLTRVPQPLVISGHIHSGQEFGKVWYVGAPRWRTLSDANVERAVWLVEFKGGETINRTPYSTGEVCRQIKHLEDSPESPVALPLNVRHQWRIDIKGPAAWCQARKKELTAAGARVRVFPTRVAASGRVRESEGVEQAFRTFLGAFQGKHGTPREVLEQMVKERLRL